ncbi:MAG: DUF5009 domain-containing protein [Alphaproteobacteria bacterium]|nr:DUF5009 domain-containing protein [Alphaproteobacteria bacterium]
MSEPARLASLDAFRGLAIGGMILVNNPGSWSHVYPPLLHADWHGFTPTDQIFPAFLFAVGAAIPFTMARYRESGDAHRRALHRRVLRRVVLLFALGLILNVATPVLQWALHGKAIDPDGLRVMGVLQRISLAYLLTMLVVMLLPLRLQVAAVILVLIGYWAALALVPVPGFGTGDLTAEGSLPAYVDRLILSPGHLYQGRFEPEGFLSTLPAFASVMFGYGAGVWIKESPVSRKVAGNLIVVGLAYTALGYLWGTTFPINKQLWTSSYTVFTGGISLVLFGILYEILEVRRWRWIGWPFQVMGMNAIFLFFASGFVARVLYTVRADDGLSLYQWIYERLFVPWAGNLNGSLAFAVATVLVWWVILYGMYRRRWFIRL